MNTPPSFIDVDISEIANSGLLTIRFIDPKVATHVLINHLRDWLNVNIPSETISRRWSYDAAFRDMSDIIVRIQIDNAADQLLVKLGYSVDNL